MRFTVRPAMAAAAIGLLLICGRAGLADDAADSATVRVKYQLGSTELANLNDGAKVFTDGGDDDLAFHDIPAELLGLTFTRRKYSFHSDATIYADPGTTVYLLFGHSNLTAKQRAAAVSAGWSPCGVFSTLRAYKRVQTDAITAKIPAGGLAGIIVVAKNLVVDTNDNHAEKKPDEPTDITPASTLHIDSTPDTTPLPGPCTRPVLAQATVNALEVYEMAHDLMLGQTSEATLTLTGSTEPRAVAVRFVTKVGDEMCLARDDAIRYIRLRYPNWYVSKGEITFEDKYVAHDGGSIGTALGTMILSCIQGFEIDPDVAITGDISANGKTRAIGGVSAKIKGAIASKCALVAIPVENLDQLTDAVVYNGPGLIEDIQVMGINNLDDAVAIVRTDREAKLTQAIELFSQLQKRLKENPQSLKSKDTVADLQRVLDLAPRHLSAQVLLAIAQGKEPKTLSAAASQYYTYLAVDNMADALKQRADSSAATSVPSSVVRAGLVSLRKLRPIADENVRPLIDAWSRWISAWNEMQEGIGSADSLEEQRQRVLDEMAKENSDADLMQKMLKQGM